MKFTLRSAFCALLSASSVLSLPLETRQQGGVTDLDVLQFALTVWFIRPSRVLNGIGS